MNTVERLHEAYGGERRLRVLCGHLAQVLPQQGRLLDVGCGDGALTARIGALRPGLDVRGIDVMVREDAKIPVAPYDGRSIPHADDAFDVVLFVDVLHHCEDPSAVLAEAARVARSCVVVKDHLLQGPLSGPLLRFMDDIGNQRFGVPCPYNYWREARWREEIDRLGLEVEAWTSRLGLYPGPLDWVFGRSLHFVARLGAKLTLPQ